MYEGVAMATLYGVIYTADDESTTEHSAHITKDDAARAGAELVKAEVERIRSWDPSAPDLPEAWAGDWDLIDWMRSHYEVRLEIEPVEVSEDVIRALIARR